MVEVERLDLNRGQADPHSKPWRKAGPAVPFGRWGGRSYCTSDERKCVASQLASQVQPPVGRRNALPAGKAAPWARPAVVVSTLKKLRAASRTRRPFPECSFLTPWFFYHSCPEFFQAQDFFKFGDFFQNSPAFALNLRSVWNNPWLKTVFPF